MNSSKFQTCSSRTKRRKIHAAVNELLSNIIGINADSSSTLDSSSDCMSQFSDVPVAAVQYGSRNEVVENFDDENVADNASDYGDAITSITGPTVTPGNASGDDDEANYEEPDMVYVSPCASDSESDPDSTTLAEQLSALAIEFKVSHRFLSALLEILRKWHPELPNDPRTLLRTPRCTDLKPMGGGFYYHFGIRVSILNVLELYQSDTEQSAIDKLDLHINIDGLPLFGSSTACLWPILGRLKQFPHARPFPIGIFSGNSKPLSLNEYLQDFVEEMKNLEITGIQFGGRNYAISLDAIICDAPARSYVKCTKGHSGYNSCERCTQAGKWAGKMTFPEMNASLRNDQGFSEMAYENHQHAVSPFSELSVGLVSQVPLDYMHSVCLGVVRKILVQWIKGPKKVRLSATQINVISTDLVKLRSWFPREFSRKPRPLSEVMQMKATEFRNFLLYSGPVVLKGKLADDLYQNFLRLSIAIRLLLSPTLCVTYLDYVNQLLRYFVATFSKLYGKTELVYNIHCLIHLCEDVHRFGALDNVSAFPFENYLGQLKKLVRRPKDPLQQIVRRLSEADQQSKQSPMNESERCKKSHTRGPLPIAYRNHAQYEQYRGENFFLSTSIGDNCVEIEGKIGLLRNILLDELSSQVLVVFEQLDNCESFFANPLPSERLSIYFIRHLDGLETVFPISSINKKCMLLPIENGYVVLPQLHYT